MLQRLEAIVVDGGDWNEDAGRWEQETRADIEALAGPGECALFVKSAPSMRDLMRQRLEYLRDRLIPRARDGYYAYQPEKYERARLLYFLRESMETAAYLRAEVKRESPDTGELAKQVAKWALNTRTLLPPARRAEFDAGLVWPEGDRLTSLQRALDSGMAVLRTMQEQLGEANRGGVVPAVALRAA